MVVVGLGVVGVGVDGEDAVGMMMVTEENPARLLVLSLSEQRGTVWYYLQ